MDRCNSYQDNLLLDLVTLIYACCIPETDDGVLVEFHLETGNEIY